MGVGGILRGLTTAAGGAEQGLANRAELERQARMSLLAQRLQEAQIGHLNAESVKALRTSTGKKQKLVDPVSGQVYGYDPETNTITPATEADFPAGAPAAPAPSSAKPPAKLGVKPKQMLGYDKDGNAIMVTVPTPGATPQTQPVAGVGRPLTLPERTAGGQTGDVDRAIQHMEELEADPKNAASIEQAAAAIRAGKLPGVIGSAAQFGKTLFLDPVANDYFTSASEYLLNTTPTYGGSRPTTQLMALEADASLPSPGEGSEARQTKTAHRRERARTMQARAGRAALGPETPAKRPAGSYKPKYDDNPYK